MATMFSLSATLSNAASPESEAIPDVQQGHAQIVVMRKTSVNALVSTLMYDVTSGQPKIVGKISNNRKVVVDVPPGDYVFMVGLNGGYEFMRASVLADKRYFAVLAPIWPTKYFLRPVRHQESDFLYSSKEFDSMLKETKLAEPYTEPMKEKEAKKVLDSYLQRWEKWQSKTAEEKAALTIQQEDSFK
jgi:hypothetical protein